MASPDAAGRSGGFLSDIEDHAPEYKLFEFDGMIPSSSKIAYGGATRYFDRVGIGCT